MNYVKHFAEILKSLPSEFREDFPRSVPKYVIDDILKFNNKYREKCGLINDYFKKLEQENKMMQECLEIIKEDKYEATPWLTVETNSAKKAKECLAKLTEGEK